MDRDGDEKIQCLFDSAFLNNYQTASCYVGFVSRKRDYIFKGKISAIPNKSRRIFPGTGFSKIKISLRLDDIDIDALYEEVKDVYGRYYNNNVELSRFELMDI